MAQQNLASFIGQLAIKKDLEVRIAAAKIRNAPLDRFLLCGAAQMGKATFANLVALEMASNVRVLNDNTKKVGDLAAILTHMKQGDFLLIEDIERIHKSLVPTLTAMQDFALDIVIGRGATAKNVRLHLPRFTMIAMSSRPSQIAQKLTQVFALRYDFAPYTIAEISQLVSIFAIQQHQEIQPDAAKLVARYCEDTPGIAKVLVKRLADFCLVKAPDSAINLNLAKEALAHLGYSARAETQAELIQRINSMNGVEFEKFVAQFFRKKGYIVEETTVSGDHGFDLFARRGQQSIAIQCKRWEKPVGEPVVREFYGSLVNSGSKMGLLIATSGFTPKAMNFADGKHIRLIDLDNLVELVSAK